ncbi:hypothetical protein X743_03450 [Mesorhizobium sp. LNHC252B00]|nr:hypothetical protein X743_03450 [Mesorhizobium sp. LNHC252B00]
MILSTLKLQSTASRRQPLPQLKPKQNFIPAARSKSGADAFQSAVRLDGQASGLC